MISRPPGLSSRLSGTQLIAIRAGVERGLSANAIQSVLRDVGAGIRRTDLLAAIRVERGSKDVVDPLRYVRKSYAPDPDRIPQALHTTLRRYSFTVRIDVYNADNPDDRFRYVNVASDTNLSIEDIEDEAASAFAEGEGPKYANVEVISYTVTHAVQSQAPRLTRRTR